MQLQSDTDIRDDLGGVMSIKFKQDSSFNDYCRTHIGNYNPDRFEIVAIRFYLKTEPVLTLYALDKSRQEGSNFTPGKIPVKKFKLHPPFLQDIIPFIEECNFTLTTGNYPLADMEVINK